MVSSMDTTVPRLRSNSDLRDASVSASMRCWICSAAAMRGCDSVMMASASRFSLSKAMRAWATWRPRSSRCCSMVRSSASVADFGSQRTMASTALFTARSAFTLTRLRMNVIMAFSRLLYVISHPGVVSHPAIAPALSSATAI